MSETDVNWYASYNAPIFFVYQGKTIVFDVTETAFNRIAPIRRMSQPSMWVPNNKIIPTFVINGFNNFSMAQIVIPLCIVRKSTFGRVRFLPRVCISRSSERE